MKPSPLRVFLIKLRSWEYWPIYVVYFPVYLYWLICSIRTRSFFFFTASNPGIINGGMLGETKWEILEKIDKKPTTILIKAGSSLDSALNEMKKMNLSFPVIGKPNIGERGWNVKKIKTEESLEKYLKEVPVDFLLQDFLDLPLEAGVFYIRRPDQNQGKITSIVVKDMLKVTGDGQSTLLKLIERHDRAYLQLNALSKNPDINLSLIPKSGETVVLNTIGNHCLGTIFLDQTYLATPEMNRAFDEIAKKIPGFFYGRFDLRAASTDDLQKGNVKIMELNGAGAEPAHIYHPGYPILKGLSSLLAHWRELYKISVMNHKSGFNYPTFSEGWNEVKKIKQYNKKYKVG